MQSFGTNGGLAIRALRVVPDVAKTIIKAWIKWFWHLGTSAKVAATAVEVVALWLAVPHIPVITAWRAAILEFGGIALCFLLVAGILFSRPARR